MKLYQSNFIKCIARELMLLVATIFLARVTAGYFAFIIALWGVYSVFAGKVARTFSCYITLLLLVVINPFILPAKGLMFTIATRGGALLIGLCAMIGGGLRRGSWRLPLSFLWVYLFVAALSSVSGWYPEISYMKLLQFSVFLMSIILGTQNIQSDRVEIERLRAYFGALSVFIVAGSLALWPFPQWSTLGALVTMRDSFGDFGAVEALVLDEMYLNQALLCGVLFHSQALAAVCGCVFAWLACDMLFCERRFDVWRSLMLLLSLIVLYLTKSRTALLSIVVACFYASFTVMHKLALPQKLRMRVKGLLWGGIILVVCISCIAEIRGDSISKWIRKTDNVMADDRTAVEALTSSRMGLIDKSMYDFKLNPWLGMGFQVEERHRYNIKGYSGSGLILSASIEKGVLPVMIIGETGVIGGFVFVVFLVLFYTSCFRMRLHVTSMMFTTFLATNMGEATFFSPGGPGGIEWMLCAVGGFILDLKIKADVQERFVAFNQYAFNSANL